MKKFAGDYWSETENLDFVGAADPFGSLAQLGGGPRRSGVLDHMKGSAWDYKGNQSYCKHRYQMMKKCDPAICMSPH